MENGSPADLESRLPRERHTYELLEQLQIPFLRVDHQPAATIADCSLVDQELGVDMCKNLFLTNAQRTKFYLLLMPGEK